MFKRALLLGLLVAAVAVSTGCHGMFRGTLLCPLGRGCDPQYCGDSCDPGCGAPWRRAWRPPRGAVCDTLCEPDCGPPCPTDCGPACGPPCRPVGPLSWLFGLVRWDRCYRLGGCGETYWGGYCSDPSDCCDPCDCYGNWRGGDCGGCYRGGYSGGHGAVGGPAPGGCTDCAQSGVTTYGPGRPALRRNRIAGAPATVPQQAWRPRTPTPVRR